MSKKPTKQTRAECEHDWVAVQRNKPTLNEDADVTLWQVQKCTKCRATRKVKVKG